MVVGSWDAAGIIDKVLIYALSLMSAGSSIFLFVFSRYIQESERRSIVRMTCGLAALALVVTVLRVPIIAGALGGDMASMWDMSLLQFVLQSSEGHAVALRSVGLALIFSLSADLSAARIAGLVGSLLVAVSFAFTGHSVELGFLPRLLVAVHLVGVSYWVGAFYPLRGLTRGADLRRIATIMKRFGDIALFVVGALILAGALLLWIVLETPLALFASDYGRLLAVKLLFVVGLLSLAAANKLILTPALLTGDISASARLRISIDAELALGAIILTVTAVLTTVSGPPALD